MNVIANRHTGLNREILRLSVPAVVSNLTVPLLGLSDTAISGHLESAAFIGAIAVGSMMLNVVFWVFGFLRMGTTGLTAQAYGAGDRRTCREIFTRAFLLGTGAGAMMTLLHYPLSGLLMALIRPDPEVAGLAAGYFRICIFGAMPQLGTMAVLGWFLGMQDTLRPMVISVSVNLLNIALSMSLVFLAGAGFTGVAVGTLSANWLGLALALALAHRFAGREGLWCGLRDAVKGTELRKFFSVNTDIFFRSMCIMGVSLAITAIGARIYPGALTLAVNAVMMQFFIFFSYFMDGLAFTGEALTGRYAGSADRVMLRRTVRTLLIWSACVATVFFIIYLTAGDGIVALITDRPDVREGVAQYRIWLLLIPPATVLAFICDGFFIGMTATRRMLAATAASASLFFVIALVDIGETGFSAGIPDNDRLWAAFLCYLFCRGAALAAMTPRLLRQVT